MPRLFIVLLALAFCMPALAQPEKGKKEPPPIFDKRPYAEAQQAAREGKKWFIVKATAEWCPPCKMMDANTWRNDDVVAWLKEHAIAIAVDVDHEPDLAKELKIEAMPTMIAFKAGADEFDRIVGYKGPDDFLDWLQGIDKGEKAPPPPPRRPARAAGGGQDMHARMDVARDLQQQRKFEEAADEYVWLWNHMLEHQPSMYGVRLSFMAGDMQRLAAASPEAAKKFAALRDEAGKDIANPRGDADQRRDWIALNSILGEEDKTLAWFDSVKDNPRWRSHLQRPDHDLKRLLFENERWADVGRLLRNPMHEIEMNHQILKMGEQFAAEHPGAGEIHSEMFRSGCAEVYAALLAAERDDEAQKVADRVRSLDPSSQMQQQLAETALRAGQPRPEHLEWKTAEGDALPSMLRKQVESALEKSRR